MRNLTVVEMVMHMLTICANDDDQGTLNLVFAMGPTGASDTRGSLSTHGVICWGGRDTYKIREWSQAVAELTFPEREDENKYDEEHDSYGASNIFVMFCKPGFSAPCEEENFQENNDKILDADCLPV